MASCVGLEDPWNTLVHSSSITVPASVEQLQQQHIPHDDGGRGQLFNFWGPAALRSWGLHERHSWSVEETILVWHIATAVYTSWYKKQEDAGTGTVEALSNYMLFLLAARPYMLPAPANRNAYVEMCYGLSCLTYSSVGDLATALQHYGASLNSAAAPSFELSWVLSSSEHNSLVHNEIFKTACMLGAKLVAGDVKLVAGELLERDRLPAAAAGDGRDSMELLLRAWADVLCNTGHRCSAYSHARQLGSGGELITVAAILSQYFIKYII